MTIEPTPTPEEIIARAIPTDGMYWPDYLDKAEGIIAILRAGGYRLINTHDESADLDAFRAQSETVIDRIDDIVDELRNLRAETYQLRATVLGGVDD